MTTKYLPDIIRLGSRFSHSGRCITMTLKLDVLYTDKDAPYSLLKAVEKHGTQHGTGCLCLDLPDAEPGLLLMTARESKSYGGEYSYQRFEPMTLQRVRELFKKADIPILKEWELNNPNWPDAYTKAGIANPRWLLKTMVGMFVIGCGRFSEDNLNGVGKTFIDWSDLKIEVYTGNANVRTQCQTHEPVAVLQKVWMKCAEVLEEKMKQRSLTSPPKSPDASSPLPDDSRDVLPNDPPPTRQFNPALFPPLQIRVLQYLASKQDTNWHALPDGVAVTTLHALERKGVVEKQYAPGMENSTQVFPYNSKSYVWRLRP